MWCVMRCTQTTGLVHRASAPTSRSPIQLTLREVPRTLRLLAESVETSFHTAQRVACLTLSFPSASTPDAASQDAASAATAHPVTSSCSSHTVAGYGILFGGDGTRNRPCKLSIKWVVQYTDRLMTPSYLAVLPFEWYRIGCELYRPGVISTG
jgi:hypothetical protein